MKKKFNKRKEKKIKEKKNKIENILKEKKLKGKKLVASVLGAAMLCTIHDATVENILFEDGDSANILCAFNPTQVILLLQKNLLLTLMKREPIC